MRRLTGISVEGLLGRFDHHIEIPEAWEFVILHGPNGVGKTRFLEIISNSFRFRPYYLSALPFSTAKFDFDDGVSLEVDRRGSTTLPLEMEDNEHERRPPSLAYRLRGFVAESVEWNLKRSLPRLSPSRIRDLERFLPVEQVGQEMWIHQASGEYMNLEDVLDRYADDLPFDVGPRHELPVPLREFLAQLDVHLIETQRLFRFESAPVTHGRVSRAPQQSTVQQFSEALSRRIKEALAQNSRTSQQLERTFPRRILEDPPVTVSDVDIRTRYQQQSDLRNSLSDIADLDQSGDLPLPQRDLETWEQRVLWKYLDDSEIKLATFRDLLVRVTLMREIVNSRFLYKELKIDPEEGFTFLSEDGQFISVDQLSSGEQHELVLLYDLLFNVKQGSIVLVDEPEISLHIAWQQQFLNDIQRIASLSDLQFIIATHSPQVVHTWSDRMVSLAPDNSDRGWPDA